MTHKTGRMDEIEAAGLTDGCGRRIDHLRLSLIDRCNLACRYCVSDRVRAQLQSLHPAFAVAMVRWLSARHGVRHVRLTGGEPLLYPRIESLIAELHALGTLDEITLTTNAQALEVRAKALRQAGLSRINISLDTLDARRFSEMTQGGIIARTRRGIEAALEAGLTPVRINVVVQRGFNDDELCDIAAWGLARHCTIRFLEMMPIGPLAGGSSDLLVPATEILGRLAERFILQPVAAHVGQPATDYSAASLDSSGPAGVIGIIASTTRPFCSQCRRLRITSRGEILSCLFDTGGSSIADAWDGHSLDEEVADRILLAAVMAKPALGRRCKSTPMIAIGG